MGDLTLMKHAGYVLLALLVFVGMLYVSNNDYQAEMAAQEAYTDRVNSGQHPDYKGILADEGIQ